MGHGRLVLIAHALPVETSEPTYAGGDNAGFVSAGCPMLRERRAKGRRICLGGRRVLRPPWSERFLGSAVCGDLFCFPDLSSSVDALGCPGREKRFTVVGVEKSVDVRVVPPKSAAWCRYTFGIQPHSDDAKACSAETQIDDVDQDPV